jgi:hypothetical protein
MGQPHKNIEGFNGTKYKISRNLDALKKTEDVLVTSVAAPEMFQFRQFCVL